jgi:hypothetical protein
MLTCDEVEKELQNGSRAEGASERHIKVHQHLAPIFRRRRERKWTRRERMGRG